MEESNDRRLLVRGFEELYSEFLRDAGSGLYAIAVCPYQSDFIQPPILWSPSQIESMRNGEEYIPTTLKAWQTAIGQCRHQGNDRPLRSVAADALETSLCSTTCVAGFVARQDQNADESARLLRQLVRLAERACVLVQSASDEDKGQATGMAALSNWLGWLYAVSMFDVRLAGMFKEAIAWRETWPSGDEYITSRTRLDGEKPKENEWISRSYCRWVQIELHRDLFTASADTVRWIVERLNRRFSKIAEFKNLDHYWPKDRNNYLVESPFGIKIEAPSTEKYIPNQWREPVRQIELRIQDWRRELDQDSKDIEASISDYQHQRDAEERAAEAEIIKNHAELKAELLKIGWERPFATSPIHTLAGIRAYLDESAADLPGFVGSKINIAEWRRSIYRNCVRALNHYCKHLSHTFQVEDASKSADAETDGLLTRLAKWMEDTMTPPIARGPYLLGYAGGQITGPARKAWEASESATEKAKWNQELVDAAHKNGIAIKTEQVSIVAVEVARHIGRVEQIDNLDSVYRMPVERVIEWLAKELAENPLCGYYNEVAAHEAEWTERYGPLRGTCWNNDRKRYERDRDAYNAGRAKEKEIYEQRLNDLPPEERKQIEQHKQFFTSSEWPEPAEPPPWGRDILREIELRHGVAPDDPRVYSIANYKAESALIEAEWRAICEAKNWPPVKADAPDSQEWWNELHLFGARLTDLTSRHFGEIERKDSEHAKSRRHLWKYIKLMVDGVERVMQDSQRIDPNNILNRVYSALHELQVEWASEPKDYLKSPTSRERIDELIRIANRLEKDEAAEIAKFAFPRAAHSIAATNTELFEASKYQSEFYSRDLATPATVQKGTVANPQVRSRSKLSENPTPKELEALQALQNLNATPGRSFVHKLRVKAQIGGDATVKTIQNHLGRCRAKGLTESEKGRNGAWRLTEKGQNLTEKKTPKKPK